VKDFIACLLLEDQSSATELLPPFLSLRFKKRKLRGDSTITLFYVRESINEIKMAVKM
jgi:hypothetical protein